MIGFYPIIQNTKCKKCTKECKRVENDEKKPIKAFFVLFLWDLRQFTFQKGKTKNYGNLAPPFLKVEKVEKVEKVDLYDFHKPVVQKVCCGIQEAIIENVIQIKKFF